MRVISLIAAGLRQIDHALGRLHGSARVLIDVRTPMNLAVLQPVWRRLLADSRVALAFVAEDATGVGEALAAEGLAHLLWAPDEARWRRVDLAVTADAWNHVPLARCRRRVNFFHGVAGKYGLDDPARLRDSAVSRVDRVAFINSDRLERYVAAGLVPRKRAALVGFPKLDDLVNGRWSAADVRHSLGLNPSLPTLLYAPTFSVANSLHAGGEALVDALLSTGHNLIVKLHDRTLVPSDRYTNGIDWPARLARFASTGRYALARGADSGPFLAAADLLVTDHSTVGFEYALLDRPIVVVDVPALKDAARIDEDKWRLLHSMADIALSAGDLPATITRALAEPDRLRAQRRQADALFAHRGAATDRAMALVYELLELPQASYEVLRRHRHA
jgi:hypothetical protein